MYSLICFRASSTDRKLYLLMQSVLIVRNSLSIAITLRVADRYEGVVEADESNELFKVLSDELAAVVGNDSWLLAVKFFQIIGNRALS